MTGEILAIIDRPTSRTMGMHGLIMRRADELLVTGMVGTKQVTKRDFDALVDGQHVLPVSGRPPTELLGPDLQRTTALWVGKAFEKEAKALGLPVPQEPREGVTRVEEGVYWLDSAEAVYGCLQLWLRRALREAGRRDGRAISDLMVRVDADAVYTRAAVWQASDNPDNELDWYCRIERDNGRPTSKSDLAAELERVIQEVNRPPLPALAVVAHAFRGSYDYARQFATDTDSLFIAFRDYFRAEAQRLFETDSRRSMVEAGRIIAAQRSPEAVVVAAVLGPLGQQPAPFTQPVVIDGFRHEHILHALEGMGEFKVTVAGFSPTNPGTPRTDGTMTVADVLSDETELEVDPLENDADVRLPHDRQTLQASFASH